MRKRKGTTTEMKTFINYNVFEYSSATPLGKHVKFKDGTIEIFFC